MGKPKARGAHFKVEDAAEKNAAVAGNATADKGEQLSARDRVRNRRRARRRIRALRRAMAALAACAVLAGVYGAGLTYFSSHYYPKTQVAGIDAAGMTADGLERALDERVASLAVDVRTEAPVARGSVFSYSLAGSDVDLACDAKAVSGAAMEAQDARRWPLDVAAALLSVPEAMAATGDQAPRAADSAGSGARSGSGTGAHDETPFSANLSFDEQKLASLVDEAVEKYNKGASQPVSATLVLDHTGTEFVVVGETEGTALDAKAVRAAVSDALARGQETVRLTTAELVQPTHRVGDQALVDARTRANMLLGLSIPLLRDGKEVARISGETFAPWLEVKDGIELGLNEEAVAAWADEHLWKQADFADGVAVHSLDASAFCDALAESIQKMMSGAVNAEGFLPRDLAIELPFVLTARYLPGEGALNPTAWNPELGRYIDVDKASQTACLYDETGRVLWETIVTTGNEASGDGTPAGQFDIYDKQTDFVLIGLDRDGDGQPDYERHVDYWMPFNGAIGLHDAAWRDTYGGTEYQGHGSGGCVNLPQDAAATLFAITHRGEMVVVHE